MKDLQYHKDDKLDAVKQRRETVMRMQDAKKRIDAKDAEKKIQLKPETSKSSIPIYKIQRSSDDSNTDLPTENILTENDNTQSSNLSNEIPGGNQGSEEGVIDYYKDQARKFLDFKIGAVEEYLNIVVRSKISGKGEGGSEKAAGNLKEKAKIANELAHKVWIPSKARRVLQYLHNPLSFPQKPHSKKAEEMQGEVTEQTTLQITTVFSREFLSKYAYPKEAPDVLARFAELDKNHISEEEVTNKIITSTSKSVLFKYGFEGLWKEEGLIQQEYDEPKSKWKWLVKDSNYGKVFSYEQLLTLKSVYNRIIDAGLNYASLSQIERDNTRQVLSDEKKSEESPYDYPGYNYMALNHVLHTLYAEFDYEEKTAKAKFYQFLEEYPLLRSYIDLNAVYENDERSVFWSQPEYIDLINLNNIKSDNLQQKLEEQISKIRKFRKEVNEDDDFLFDNKILASVQPLIALFKAVNPVWETWILKEFENKKKWDEFFDTLLNLAGMIGFVLAEALTGGWAIVAFGAGLGAVIMSTVKANEEASQAEGGFMASVTDVDTVALAKYNAWLANAMAGLTFLLSAGMLVRYSKGLVKGIKSIPPRITSTVVATKGTFTAAEQATVTSITNEIKKAVAEAVKIVESGTGAKTTWGRLYQSSNKTNAMWKGNAINFEATEILESNPLFNNRALFNKGGLSSELGFTNKFPGRMRPDVRIALSNGNEVVFDISTLGQMGSKVKYNQPWVKAIIGIAY